MTATAPKPAHEQEHNALPTQMQVKAVLAVSRDDILASRQAIRNRFAMVEDAVTALVDAFIDGRYAEIKAASERVRMEAQSLPILVTEKSRQMEYIAGGLITGCCHQLNRKARV